MTFEFHLKTHSFSLLALRWDPQIYALFPCPSCDSGVACPRQILSNPGNPGSIPGLITDHLQPPSIHPQEFPCQYIRLGCPHPIALSHWKQTRRIGKTRLIGETWVTIINNLLFCIILTNDLLHSSESELALWSKLEL